MNNDISNLKNITVLYVEDEKDLREVTSSILQSFTKNQYIATNGQEGYELFLKHDSDIDLIISDINMPILNGLEMIKKIKDINKNVPIIVTTAFSNKEYLLEAIDIGVDKYILKPVDVSKLLQAMSQSLNYHELKDLYLDSLTNLSNRNKLKKDLNILDPTTFPTAISTFPFFAAIIEIANSGNEIPAEIIVNAIILSDIPNPSAILVLDSSIKSPPRDNNPIPTTISIPQTVFE